jgi:hypothetical protein
MAEHEHDHLFLTLSAEEMGKVVVAIIKGVERSEAIRTMPRYTKERHAVFAMFYDQLKEVIDAEQDR